MPDDQDQQIPEDNEGNQSLGDMSPSEEQDNTSSISSSEADDETSSNGDFSADLSHIDSSTISMARGNIINIRVDTPAQAREIYKTIREEELTRQRPKPPSPDAPLQEQISHWFKHDLENDRERFYVITLSMFNGLKYADFKDIYEIVLDVMKVTKNDKEKTNSYFSNPDEELVEKAHAELIRDKDGREEILQFVQAEYETAIFQTLRESFRNVLLDLLPALKRIGENSYWQIRSRAAEAVAEISKMGWHRVRSKVLEPWSRDQRAYVRAVVGYTLTRLFDDEITRVAVQDLLNDWSDINHPRGNANWAWRVPWTAASAYKQIGMVNPDAAFDGLKKIARFNDIRVGDSVIHTLVVLSLRGQLEKVIITLGNWIAEGTGGRGHDEESEITCVVAILAFMVLSNIHVEVVEEDIDGEAGQFTARAENLFDLVRTSAADRGRVWESVVGLGVRSFEYKLADNFFDLIERWSEFTEKDARLLDTICDLLSEIFQSIKPRYRERILNKLNSWERQTKEKTLANMAHCAKIEIKRRVLG
jgi:hypothetical protein